MSSLKKHYYWLSKKDLKDLEWFRAKDKGSTFLLVHCIHEDSEEEIHEPLSASKEIPCL